MFCAGDGCVCVVHSVYVIVECISQTNYKLWDAHLTAFEHV